MTTETPTIDQVIELARQLPPETRVELVAQIVRELVTDVPAPRTNDAWERLNQFRDELATLSPTSPTLAEQLDSDRRERQALIEGSPS